MIKSKNSFIGDGAVVTEAFAIPGCVAVNAILGAEPCADKPLVGKRSRLSCFFLTVGAYVHLDCELTIRELR